MKNFLFILGFLGILGGCTNVVKQDVDTKSYQEMMINGKNGYIGKLITNNNWESAIFIEKNNRNNLTRAVSGDGIKMENDNISIHFKNGEGILERKK